MREVPMQRTANGRWLWWFRRCSMRVMEVHCPCFISSRHILEPSREMDFSSASQQELLLVSTTSSSQSTAELRRKNCWKLWKYRRLSVEQISFVLQMQRDTVISNILNFERTVDHVDWSRLSTLVGLTTSKTQAIFRATIRANMELCISSDANYLSTLDIKETRFQSYQVTLLQINLVHAMLERGLKTSEILHLASSTVEDGNNVEDNIHRKKTAFVRSQTKEKASSAAFSECSSGEERLSAEISEETDADFKNSTHACEGVEGQKIEALADSLGFITKAPRPNLSTMCDLIQWLQKNQMVVCAFTYCEAQHMMLLLLELLENAIMLVKANMSKNASEGTPCRLKMPGRSPVQTHHLLARMHRALCLKAVLLGVIIHAPKRNVEFVVRSLKAPSQRPSNVYRVHICKSPSCTCADFDCGRKVGYVYRPCKHLFYIYMVQLSIEKDLEHLMFQTDLMEDDLERMLHGYY